MKPKALDIQLECDDGYFNIRWTELGKEEKACEWKVLGGAGDPCGKTSRPNEDFGGATNYWCIECGLVVCEKHRRGHAASVQHQQRLDKWRADGVDIPVI